jgi:hypothetical protein
MYTDREKHSLISVIKERKWGSDPREYEKPCCSEAEADPSAQRYQSGRIQIISTGSREGQVSRNLYFHTALRIRIQDPSASARDP